MTNIDAPVEQELIGALEQCPEYSYLNGRRCSCRRGYQASSDSRRCGNANLIWRLEIHGLPAVSDPVQAILSEYLGDPNSDLGGFNEDDCRQVFSGPVIVYANLRCQCDSESFVNNASRGCCIYERNHSRSDVLEFVLLSRASSQSPNNSRAKS